MSLPKGQATFLARPAALAYWTAFSHQARHLKEVLNKLTPTPHIAREPAAKKQNPYRECDQCYNWKPSSGRPESHAFGLDL
eukprot:1118009-Amphidinium_carterae.1